MEDFKKYFYRFWNAIKIPMVLLIILVITEITSDVRDAGTVAVLGEFETWNNLLYTAVVMVLPAISAALDKLLRDKGFYIENVFTGFKLRDSNEG